MTKNFKTALNSQNLNDMHFAIKNGEINPTETLILKTLAQLFLEGLKYSDASLTVKVDSEEINIKYAIAEFERLGYNVEYFEDYFEYLYIFQ